MILNINTLRLQIPTILLDIHILPCLVNALFIRGSFLLSGFILKDQNTEISTNIEQPLELQCLDYGHRNSENSIMKHIDTADSIISPSSAPSGWKG